MTNNKDQLVTGMDPELELQLLREEKERLELLNTLDNLKYELGEETVDEEIGNFSVALCVLFVPFALGYFLYNILWKRKRKRALKALLIGIVAEIVKLVIALLIFNA